MVESGFLRAVFLALGLVLLAPVAKAVELSLQIPPTATALADRLKSASLTVSTAARKNATAQELLAAARADYARLVGVLYETGHYGSRVNILIDGREAASIPPIGSPSRINRIVLRVSPGPPFVFSTARVSPLAIGTQLPEGFAQGHPAFSGLIGDAARAGIDGWRNIGHAKADISGQQITADHRARTLSAQIALSPGPRLRFGNLNVTEPGDVRPSRVRAIAALPRGEVYSPETLDKSAERLRRTGAFQSVVLKESDVIGPDNTLDINAKVIDAEPRRIGIGAEVSSTEGLTLSGFWLHRNLLGGAERFRIDGEVGGIGGDSGGIDYVLSARYQRPATFTPDTSLFVTATIEEEDEPDFRERGVELGIGVSHIFSDKLTGEASVGYRFSDIDDDLSSRRLQHLLFPVQLTWDDRDDKLDATKGWYLNLETTPFTEITNGASGVRLYADLRGYKALGRDDGVVLAARAQLGSVAGAGLPDIPPNMLFFSGGAGTVRGQPYQSLAVDFAPGRRIGGRSFLGFSGEVRAPVAKKLSLVAFADTGFVGRNSWGSGGLWHSGAGLGARYATGIGPIRVDLATPLDSDAGNDFEIYIGIGQAF